MTLLRVPTIWNVHILTMQKGTNSTAERTEAMASWMSQSVSFRDNDDILAELHSYLGYVKHIRFEKIKSKDNLVWTIGNGNHAQKVDNLAVYTATGEQKSQTPYNISTEISIVRREGRLQWRPNRCEFLILIPPMGPIFSFFYIRGLNKSSLVVYEWSKGPRYKGGV